MITGNKFVKGTEKHKGRCCVTLEETQQFVYIYKYLKKVIQTKRDGL